jgi:hypothetical protein
MLAALIPLLGTIIDKAIPDPQAAADAKLKTLELMQRGELAVLDADLKIALGQIETNKVEAASTDPFRGGWRPAAGWVCVFGLFYTFLLKPLLPWVVALFGLQVEPLPAIDTMELIALLGGMLGLGGFRTFERIKGKA